MSPAMIQVVIAGITLLILWSSTIAGAVVWLTNYIKSTKEEILVDFDLKHKANAQTVEALKELVIRHDVLLNAEFGAPQKNGRSPLRG